MPHGRLVGTRRRAGGDDYEDAMMLTHDDPRRQLLDYFPRHQRSTVANIFLGAVRAGATTVPDVLQRVERAFLGRLDAGQRYRDVLAQQQARAALDILAAHPHRAADLAAWCLEWEALPREERERLKAQRGDEHRRQWLEEQPATPKQRDYLRALGYTGEIRSKAHASQLIDELKRARVA